MLGISINRGRIIRICNSHGNETLFHQLILQLLLSFLGELSPRIFRIQLPFRCNIVVNFVPIAYWFIQIYPCFLVVLCIIQHARSNP